jgi:hypothetical protein
MTRMLNYRQSFCWRMKRPMLRERYLENFRRYRLTASASLFLVSMSVYAGMLMITKGYYYWSSFFGAQTSSAIFFSLVFLGVVAQLVRRRLQDIEVFSIALATTISSIWLYELIYHYSFIGYFNFFRYPFFQFSDASSMIIDGALSLLILVGYKHINVKRNYPLWGLLLVFLILYATWLLLGFPQYTDRTFKLDRLIFMEDPFPAAFFLNRFSKLFLCLAWVSLYFRRDCSIHHSPDVDSPSQCLTASSEVQLAKLNLH